MSKPKAHKGPGRPSLPATEKKTAVSIKFPPNLIDWMREQPESMATLIEAAMVEHYDLCPKCLRPLHAFHDCELNPVADPGKIEIGLN